MAGMQFEYDEEGGTFYYFLLSFWALVLFPATYYLWPRKKSRDDGKKRSRECNCEPCCLKREALKSKEPWLKAREKTVNKLQQNATLRKAVLVVGWIIFLLLAYKVSKIQLDYEEYDPFKELGLDKGASVAEIKKAYRRLSLTHHPDRGGDHKRFMRISKAYAALTDEESRKNWETYGNPDGPGVTRFGIALPKWIVERENSMWVLAAYGLLFMVILPIVVGVWWYRSIRFSGDQVLLDTTRLYWYYLNKTPNMILKRAAMILSASFEFNRAHNTEITERPSDNVEIPTLMKDLNNLQEKNKERPLCFPYSVKARALLLAHFQRLHLPPHTLEIDKRIILQKCPYLINEMVNICANQVALGMSGKIHQAPRLETIENIMKLSQMVVQGLEEKANPLQQLPHIQPDMLRHFTTKKRNIRGMRDLVMMKDDDRRSMLRGLSDEAYEDLMEVLRRMPQVSLEVGLRVLDDEDSKIITAGSIVTVTVRLVRRSMEELMELPDRAPVEDVSAASVQEEEEEAAEEDKQVANPSPQHRPHKVWEKQKKKQKKGGAKPKKRPAPKSGPQKAAPTKEAADGKAGGDAPKAAKAEDNGDEEDMEDEREEGEEGEEDDRQGDEVREDRRGREREDDEDDWAKFQRESKKENSLETKVKESHPVHCPYFPAEKQECWWLYVADRKRHMLITAPVFVCSLKSEEEVELKFSAPQKPGHYQYTVVLRSDSYFLDLDKSSTIKLDVKEAKIVEDHPQWDISDEEDKDKDDETEDDSDYDSEEDDSE